LEREFQGLGKEHGPAFCSACLWFNGYETIALLKNTEHVQNQIHETTATSILCHPERSWARSLRSTQPKDLPSGPEDPAGFSPIDNRKTSKMLRFCIPQRIISYSYGRINCPSGRFLLPNCGRSGPFSRFLIRRAVSPGSSEEGETKSFTSWGLTRNKRGPGGQHYC
jgi:hypothetical protein